MAAPVYVNVSVSTASCISCAFTLALPPLFVYSFCPSLIFVDFILSYLIFSFILVACSFSNERERKGLDLGR